jgi:hypothetical protein
MMGGSGRRGIAGSEVSAQTDVRHDAAHYNRKLRKKKGIGASTGADRGPDEKSARPALPRVGRVR